MTEPRKAEKVGPRESTKRHDHAALAQSQHDQEFAKVATSQLRYRTPKLASIARASELQPPGRDDLSVKLRELE